MLQQTTVKTVIPYYEAFLARFESIEQLAAAREEDVLTLWSGLGYYHRARSLHRGAKNLVDSFGGRFPRTLEAAVAVPGVGLYTASAVLSIAHGVPLPVVDGNVRRVLARLFCLRGPRWKKDGAYYNLAEELLDREHPGDWNQALMELGPACPVCPIRGQCLAHAQGLQAELPEGRARRPTVAVTVAAALVEEGARVLLVRRAEGRLLGRLWEVPQTSLESRGLEDLVVEAKLVPGELAVLARHTITHHRIRAEGYRARLARRPPSDPERCRWAGPQDLAGLPVTSLTKKLVRGLFAPQQTLDPTLLGGQQ